MKQSGNFLLKGIRVLDLSRFGVGPMCTQMLADLGAEVIKVQNPNSGGDPFRHLGPPFLENKLSPFFHSLNRHKKSIILDFQDEQAREVIFELARQSDVLVQNFRSETVQKYNLKYETFKKVNEKLIYCSISGFGPQNDHTPKAAFDPIVQAFTGVTNLTGYPQQKGVKVGFPVSDILTAYVAYGSVLAAIIERLKTGKGQFVETSLFATMMHSLVNVSGTVSNGLPMGQRVGNRHHQICPYGVFTTKDGVDITLAPNTDSIFRKLAKIINYNIPEKFKTNPARVEFKEQFLPEFEAQFAKFTCDQLIPELEEAQIPYSLILTFEECLKHPHTSASGVVQEGEDGYNHMAHPASFSNIKIRAPSKVPELGEHSQEILREVLKYDDNLIEKVLKSQKQVKYERKKAMK